jgi:hypothetical protein
LTGALVDLSNADQREVAAEFLVELLAILPKLEFVAGSGSGDAQVVGVLDLEAAPTPSRTTSRISRANRH